MFIQEFLICLRTSVLLVTVNSLSVTLANYVQNFFTVAKVLIIVVIVIAGIVMLAQGGPQSSTLGEEETSHPAYLDSAVVSVQEEQRIFQTPLKARQRPSEQSDSRSTMDFGLMMDGNATAYCPFIVRYKRLINNCEVFTRVVYINVLNKH